MPAWRVAICGQEQQIDDTTYRLEHLVIHALTLRRRRLFFIAQACIMCLGHWYSTHHFQEE